MINPNELAAMAQFLAQHDDYLIICHENPDGDALGSLFALQQGLVKAGKRVQAACADEVPYKYRHLAGADRLLLPPQVQPFETLIMVDCGDRHRAGAASCFLSQASTVCNIDHHATNDGFGDYNIVSPRSAATAVIVFALLEAMNIAIDEPIASDLLLGISTDTGHFAHANTDEASLLAASKLVALGANPNAIAQQMYQVHTLAWVRLLGQALKNLEMHYEDRCALIALTLEDFERCGATQAMTEGLIDTARNIETVSVAVLLRESEKGIIKASLRSKGTVEVDGIAGQFGGGGHKRAAGCTVAGTIDEVKARILAALEQVFSQ